MKARLRHRFGRAEGADHRLLLLLDRVPAGAGQKHRKQSDHKADRRLLHVLQACSPSLFRLSRLSFRRDLSVILPKRIPKIKLEHAVLPYVLSAGSLSRPAVRKYDKGIVTHLYGLGNAKIQGK